MSTQMRDAAHQSRLLLPHDDGLFLDSLVIQSLGDLCCVPGQQIADIAEKYGGYVNEMGTYQATIRVESGQLDAAIADLATLGKLARKNIVGQDVTEAYQDYQIRLENAQKARDRYLELLNKAETVEEILKVERELERLNETIDLLKGKMARIEHLEAYSTITVALRERKKPGLLGYIGLGVYHAVKWLFVRN